jgi:hypothetical protein
MSNTHMSNTQTRQGRGWYWIAASGIVAALALAAFFVLKTPQFGSTTASGRIPVDAHEKTPRAALDHRAEAAHPVRKSATSTTAAAWTAKFRSSDNYLKFVIEALPAAQNGDGRAAWYIGEALTSCALVMKTYLGSADPEAQLNQELANMTKAPQWARDLQAQTTRRCMGLARADPFENLPQRDNGYTSSYWHDLALTDGDPLAQEQAAKDALAAISVARDMSDEARTDKINLGERDLRAAVESGDPDALYAAGMLLANPRYSSNSLNGIAVALASCDLGHDCSADNPDNAFYNCKLSGSCPANADYAYFVQQSLGPEQYAQVYAHAQEIKQSVQAQDWDAVLANLKIDKHP